MPNLFSVILAGGSGTRFWPLSRKKRPKQLLPLAGQDSLVKATQKRLVDLVPLDRRIVLTNQDQAEGVKAELKGLVKPENILMEPMGRDTAAAAILGALAVRARDPEGIMAVLPADHVITPREALTRTVAAATEVAAAGPTLVTIGIRPRSPETGYGYIKKGTSTFSTRGLTFHRVEVFKEKPDQDTARSYLEEGGYYWNSGMFIWAASTLLDLAGRFLPDSLQQLEPLIREGRPLPGPEDLRDAFLALEKIPVDKGILEKAPSHVVMVEAQFTWDDVGAWTAVEDHVDRDTEGNAVRGLIHLRKTRDTTIFTTEDHLVATLGIQDLVIVHTPDATLVARKKDVQEIKDIVEALENEGHGDRI